MFRYPTLAFALALTLAGCAGSGGETHWRQLGAAPGQGDTSAASQQALEQANAQCRYETAQAAAGASPAPIAASGPYAEGVSVLGSAMITGPGPRFFAMCMNAKGWEQAP